MYTLIELLIMQYGQDLYCQPADSSLIQDVLKFRVHMLILFAEESSFDISQTTGQTGFFARQVKKSTCFVGKWIFLICQPHPAYHTYLLQNTNVIKLRLYAV